LTLNLFDAEPASGAAQLVAWQPHTWRAAQDWQPLLDAFWASAAGAQLGQFVQQRLAAGAQVYPPQPLRALELTALHEVRVVILGQDPYHGAGQAEGLAFSVARGVKLPPSLRNIFKELQRDLGLPIPSHGSLTNWAAQGVLLLNTTLTVEDGQPASHAKQGWEALTDGIIQTCAQKTSPVVFMLWGAHAQAKQALIAAHNLDARHAVLLANHPSPLSALRPPTPFIGCGHFGAARKWLMQADSQTDVKAAQSLFI
jgi:uracil-DNA glycosylase